METAKTDRPIKKENAMEGNQMKMREALIELRKSCQNWIRFGTIHKKTFEIYIDLIDVALSAPARNCDRFEDELDAQLAFLNEVWLISVDRETMLERDKYENWTDEMRKRYGRWLLAPAAEREGERR